MFRHLSLAVAVLAAVLSPAPSVPVPEGINKCVAPDVRGQTAEQARQTLTGLPKNTVTILLEPADAPPEPASYVLGYRLSECTTDSPYQAYTITLELGTMVPGLRDLNRDDAETALAAARLVPVPQPRGASADWTVTRQSPAAGELARYDSPVGFELVAPSIPSISPSPGLSPSPSPEVVIPSPGESTPTPSPEDPSPSRGEPDVGDAGPVAIPITETGGASPLPGLLGGVVLVLLLVGLVSAARFRRARPAGAPLASPAWEPPPAPRDPFLEGTPRENARRADPRAGILCVAHPDTAPRLEIHPDGSASPTGPPDIRVELHADPGHQELREVTP